MKTYISSQRNRAMTLPEVLVVVAILVVLIALLLPVLAASRRGPSRINCLSNLKQVNLSFRIWEGDNNNKYPMQVSITNGGAMETTVTGDVVNCYRVMSNELSTPMILCCPDDTERTPTRSFGPNLNSSNISYFVGVDADESYPQRIMSGDDNFLIKGIPVRPGLVQYPTNTSIAWGPGRHEYVPDHHFWTPKQHISFGNIGYADGSVAQPTSTELQEAFWQSEVATNRLAIP